MSSGSNDNNALPATTQNNGTSVSAYDTSNLTDEELAKKAQEELNMEGEMEEVRKILTMVED